MKKILLMSLSLLFTAIAQAQVVVNSPWVRATVANQKVTGAFMQIVAAKDAKLIEINSPVAGSVEMHLSVMEGGVMKMRQVTAVELPAGQSVDLKPGSYHLMLVDLKQPIQEGGTVPIVMTIEYRNKKRETVKANLSVRPINNLQ